MGLVIDTSTVAPHERTELWSATTSALFFPSEMSFAGGSAYAGTMSQYTLGPLSLFRVRGCGALTLDRTTRGITCADPEFFAVSMLRRGRLRACQEERASHVGPGVLSVYDSSLPFTLRADEGFDQLVVTRGPHREQGGVGGDEQDLADGLLALLRGLHAPVEREAAAERLPAVHLRSIKAYIDAHLGDPGLGPESIARSQFISRRYLHALFEREGVSVSSWVRMRRLERARHDLQDPALAAAPIQAIAHRWGFSSASHFSHAVRAELGCSPRELRAAAARRRPPS